MLVDSSAPHLPTTLHLSGSIRPHLYSHDSHQSPINKFQISKPSKLHVPPLLRPPHRRRRLNVCLSLIWQNSLGASPSLPYPPSQQPDKLPLDAKKSHPYSPQLPLRNPFDESHLLPVKDQKYGVLYCIESSLAYSDISANYRLVQLSYP